MVRMIFPFRKYLVVILVLLQFIAPLVHAHTREHGLSHGLHIPGLEVYEDFSSQDALVSVKACSLGDGQVVSVGTGLGIDIAMQRLHKIPADLDYDYYLPLQAVVFKTVVFTFTTMPATQSASLPAQSAHVAHSSRAPPAQV